MHSRFIKLMVLIVFGLLLSRPAFAYVDPVNGAMLLQIVISGIAGASVVFRKIIGNFIRRIKARFSDDSKD